MVRKFEIDGKIITDDSNPYIIAEIGHNHGGNLETCKDLFMVAKQCGADAVKLQKRFNKSLFTKAAYNKPYDNPNSYGATYGEHREALEFGLREYKELQDHAYGLDITLFATAFDIPSAEFLHGLDMPAYKIASADITNIPLIMHIRSFGKPMILSTGGCNAEDVQRAYDALIRDNGLPEAEFALLHCVASYPNLAEDMNLRCIDAMRHKYEDTIIGLSDHFNGICIAEAAIARGASIVEKHFTLNHTWKGTDHALSLEPQGLESLVKNSKRIKSSMGSPEKILLPKEVEPIKKMGKSLWPQKALMAGTVLTPLNIVVKSPGGGLPPYKLDDVNGKIAIHDLSTSEPLKEGDIE